MIMPTTLLTKKNEFRDFVIDRLGRTPVDFDEKLQYIDVLRRSKERHLAAGVLLILDFKQKAGLNGSESGEYVFQLIKRSDKVPQPGDLSCPGGRLNFLIDAVLGRLTAVMFSHIMKGEALKHAAKRGRSSFKAINLILANALRESWEEVRLNPFNITYLGAMPSYTFSPARRTIFPVAGLMKISSSLRPNAEVEKVVSIPVSAFFNAENYANFVIEPPLPERQNHDYPQDYPCLVYRDTDGSQEILWGATFNIIMEFLRLTFDLRQPDLTGKKTVKKALRHDYMRYLKE